MPVQSSLMSIGSLDGPGAGDHDVPFRFGCRPRAIAPYPFSTYQYARLLVLRGQVQDGIVSNDDVKVSRAPRRVSPTQ